MTAQRAVGWETSVVYGIGAFGSAAKTVPVTTFLMLFYNQVVGLPALVVSAVLMVALVCDALFDPIIGQVSDHHQSRWGRRLPFMYLSLLPLTLLFILLWMPPAGWSAWALTAWLAVCLVGLRLFDTFFELPHLALIPELTAGYHERTKLLTVRYLFEAMGGLLVTYLAYNIFMKELPDGTGGLLSPDGYPAFALCTGLLIFAAIASCTAGLHRRLSRVVLAPDGTRSIRAHFREMAATLGSRSFAVLATAAVFVSFGSGIGSALSIYWLMYFYQFTQAQMTMLAFPVLLGIGLTALTPAITRRLGKRNAAILFCWVYLVSVAVPLIARMLDLVTAKSTALMVIVGGQAALGAAMMMMMLITLASMISDLVEEAEVRTGRRSEGLLLAANSLVRKATLGFGTFGAGIVLTAVAFPEGVERRDVSGDLLSDMAVLYLAIKVVLFSLATATLLLYRYDRAAHERNLETLAARSADTVALPEPSGSDQPIRGQALDLAP